MNITGFYILPETALPRSRSTPEIHVYRNASSCTNPANLAQACLLLVLNSAYYFRWSFRVPRARDTTFLPPSPPAASVPLYFRQSLPPVPPNTHSQWAPVCSEHPSLAPRSWSGPSFSILPALLRASENLEAAALGKAVAVTVVRLQQPGQFEPMRDKPPKRINTLSH